MQEDVEMHVNQLTRLVREAWLSAGGDWEEFILAVDKISPALADSFETKQLKRELFLALHMGNFQTALREVIG